MLVSLFILCLPSQQSERWLEADTFFQFLILVLHCPLPPVGRSRLFHEHVLHVFWANVSHVHLYLPFKDLSVPLWSPDAQVTGFAHHRSCRSPHLPPRLDVKSLIHPSFFSFDWSFSNPHPFCPVLCGQSSEIFLHLKTKHLHEEGQLGLAVGIALLACRRPRPFSSLDFLQIVDVLLAVLVPVLNSLCFPPLANVLDVI